MANVKKAILNIRINVGIGLRYREVIPDYRSYTFENTHVYMPWFFIPELSMDDHG